MARMPHAPPDIVRPSSVAPLGQLPLTGEIVMAEKSGGVTQRTVAAAPPVPRIVIPLAITYPVPAGAVYVPGATFKVHGVVDTAMMFARMLPLVPVEIDCTIDPFWQLAAASRGDATNRKRTPSTDVKMDRDMFDSQDQQG